MFVEKRMLTLMCSRLAPILYKDEGKRIVEQVLEETLDELLFAGVRELAEEASKTGQ